MGSSPLARGLLRAQGRSVPRGRIIPARAGFTPRGSTSPPTPADHPRSRGVYVSSCPGTCSGAGSSPLARGLRPRPARTACGPRIIPARAGFTRPRPRMVVGRWDHPRSRGVYDPAAVLPEADGGSSPLARGLRGNRPLPLPGDRIIPARAGFTRSCALPCRPGRDHPRSRGVYETKVTREKG